MFFADSGNREKLIIILTAVIICILFYLIFEPISAVGDAPAYLLYAKLIAEGGDTSGFIHRSPLYSYLISHFIGNFTGETSVKIVMAMNFTFLFFTALLLQDMGAGLFRKAWQRYTAVALVLFNMSVLFFAYMILTEMLSLFLLVLTIWCLVTNREGKTSILYIASGIAFSLLVLARFNTLPLVAVIAVAIAFDYLSPQQPNRKAIALRITLFLTPVLLILNGYALVNHSRHGFYGIFPTGGSLLVSRNAIISTIEGNERVSEEHREVLCIFVAAGVEYNQKRAILTRKGSLGSYDRRNYLDRIYRGFPVYLSAADELSAHYGIDRHSLEPELSRELKPFYSEIIRENRKQIWELRFLSLLSSFRSSTGLVTGIEPPVNLDRVPELLIRMHKVAMIGLKGSFTLAAMLWIFMVLAGKAVYNRIVMTISLLWLGFLFINFSLALVNDSNRYTFPVEPLIPVVAFWLLTAIRRREMSPAGR